MNARNGSNSVPFSREMAIDLSAKSKARLALMTTHDLPEFPSPCPKVSSYRGTARLAGELKQGPRLIKPFKLMNPPVVMYPPNFPAVSDRVARTLAENKKKDNPLKTNTLSGCKFLSFKSFV